MPIRSALFAATTVLAACLLVGCTSSRESYTADQATETVGQYAPPPQGVERPKAGVPPFLIEAEDLGADMAKVAADQITTLLLLSQRFQVIERAQLQQLLKEQGLEGIVRPDELAASGKVRGVEYLMVGKITNFRAKREKKGGGFGFGRVNLPGGGSFGGLDVKKEDVVITVDVGVDLRLVKPEDGAVVAAHFGEYKRTDSAGALGIDILGASASADADLQIDEDNKGKLLRLALDSTLRKMLPQIDAILLQQHATAAPQKPVTGAAAGVAPGATEGDADLHKFCSQCGTKLPQDSKFCSKCGGKQ